MTEEDTTARWDGERTQDAENAAAEQRAQAYADQLDGTRAELESWRARALRPASRLARGPGQTVPPDAEPQQAEQGCQDCALLQQEAQRLRQIHSALRRHLDDALYLLGQVRDERDEALRQRDMAHLRVADEADGDAQEQEPADDRPPMDLRS